MSSLLDRLHLRAILEELRQSRRPWEPRPGEGANPWVKISRDLVRWAILAVPIGVVAGIGAVLFYALWLGATDLFLGTIAGITYPLASGSTQSLQWGGSLPRILLLPLVMGVGGLGAGLIAEKLAPEVAGHGTDQTIRAFHRSGGRIRIRVPFLKILASSLTLGTGGSGGREGPVSQIGGGFGSWWAEVLGLSTRERRLALATGLGAGVGAIFRAPLGGAIYSAEIFYTGDFEPEVFVPAIISSVVSYSLFGAFYGFGSLFVSPAGLNWTIYQIPLYALLGILCAGVGIGFVRLFHGTHRLFSRTRLRLSLRACLGALLSSGVVLAAYFVFPWDNHFAALSALNVGYGFVQAAMLGQGGLVVFATPALLAVAMAIGLRMVTTSLTVGSGGSAGLFGTSVVIGAFLGTTIGQLFHFLSPGLVLTTDIASFVIVGMMAFFGGISKAPLAVLVMVVEMAGSYTLLLPAMLAIFLAYVATGNNHLYPEQVPTRLSSPAHREEYREQFLSELPVVAMMKPISIQVSPGTTARDALDVVARSDEPILPVVHDEEFIGFVRVRDLLLIPEDRRGSVLVGDVTREFDVTVDGVSPAAEALSCLERQGSEAAAVVSSDPPIRIVGLVTRQGLLQLHAPRSSRLAVRTEHS